MAPWPNRAPEGRRQVPDGRCVGLRGTGGTCSLRPMGPGDGEPIMRTHPSPDVKLSALSQDQAEDATMGLAIAMLDNSDALAVIPGPRCRPDPSPDP